MAQEDSHAVQYLLQIQITDTEDKIANTHKKLELGRRDWESEMDRHSAEVNCHQKKIFDDAFSLFNKEPLGITDKMKALVKELADFDGTPEQIQEKKNDVYFELKAHIQFIRTRYNKKS